MSEGKTINIVGLNEQSIKEHFYQFQEIEHGYCVPESWLNSDTVWKIGNYLYELQNKWTYSYAAMDENNVLAGFIIASEKNKGNVHIHRWFTRSNYRRQRIGSRLFMRLYNTAKHNGINTASIAVYENNIHACKFYKHLGFRKSSAMVVDDNENSNCVLSVSLESINLPELDKLQK